MRKNTDAIIIYSSLTILAPYEIIRRTALRPPFGAPMPHADGWAAAEDVRYGRRIARNVGAGLGGRLAREAPKAPAPFDPWDLAFGGAVMSDYVFRGITQSNHQASVAAYFEPRYNVNKNLQLYVGTSIESISFANRAAAEVDIYGGVRPTFGAFALDFGVWGYLYPGGQCQEGLPGGVAVCPPGSALVLGPDFTQLKKDLSFYEGYGKVKWTISASFALGANEYYTPSFLNSGAWGD